MSLEDIDKATRTNNVFPHAEHLKQHLNDSARLTQAVVFEKRFSQLMEIYQYVALMLLN
jgi:hypothetical protein